MAYTDLHNSETDILAAHDNRDIRIYDEELSEVFIYADHTGSDVASLAYDSDHESWKDTREDDEDTKPLTQSVSSAVQLMAAQRTNINESNLRLKAMHNISNRRQPDIPSAEEDHGETAYDQDSTHENSDNRQNLTPRTSPWLHFEDDL